MTRQIIIDPTVKAINQFPEDKAEEISDFADFVIKRYEEHRLTTGIQQLASDSQAFEFLNNESTSEIFKESGTHYQFTGRKAQS